MMGLVQKWLWKSPPYLMRENGKVTIVSPVSPTRSRVGFASSSQKRRTGAVASSRGAQRRRPRASSRPRLRDSSGSSSRSPNGNRAAQQHAANATTNSEQPLLRGPLPYGMKRHDYVSSPPPVWPLPPHPPPKKNLFRRYFPFMVMAVGAAGFCYVLFHQDKEVYEYWRQVEEGSVPSSPSHGKDNHNNEEGDDDDDDDIDDEDGEDDEWGDIEKEEPRFRGKLNQPSK